MTKRPKPIVLTVLDGWGYRAETKGNAIALARKPNYDRLLAEFPNTLIHTSGPAVGLPEGQMGNSEVGHMNMGAGRVVQMDITRIDQAIASGALFHNDLLLGAMRRGRERQLHLIGLVSDGGVHSHTEHLFALLRMAQQNKVERVFIHCFLDGRDTPPHSGMEFVRQLQQKMREVGVGRIASLTGRYYAMDRDNRWERVERAYRAAVHGEPNCACPIRSRRCAAATRKTSPTNSSCRWSSPPARRPRHRRWPASATTMPSSSSTSAPTAPASSPAPSPSPASTSSPTPRALKIFASWA